MRLFAHLTGRPGQRLSAMVRPAMKLPPATIARLAAAATTPAGTPGPATGLPVPGPGPVFTAAGLRTGAATATVHTDATLTGRPVNSEPSHVLDAVVAPGATILPPGRYVVVYDRVGPHGRRGTTNPKPKPIVVDARDAADLADAIREDIQRYIAQPGLLEVFVDLQVSGGDIHVSGHRLGTFDFSPATTAQDGAPAA